MAEPTRSARPGPAAHRLSQPPTPRNALRIKIFAFLANNIGMPSNCFHTSFFRCKFVDVRLNAPLAV